MPRRSRSRKSLRGGNANTLPMEYFGGDSGNYHVDSSVNQAGSGAYGDFVAQSFGEPFNNTGTGPNMFVHPNSSGSQTGGRRSRRSRSSRSSRRSRRSSRRIRRSRRSRRSSRRIRRRRISRSTRSKRLRRSLKGGSEKSPCGSNQNTFQQQFIGNFFNKYPNQPNPPTAEEYLKEKQDYGHGPTQTFLSKNTFAGDLVQWIENTNRPSIPGFKRSNIAVPQFKVIYGLCSDWVNIIKSDDNDRFYNNIQDQNRQETAKKTAEKTNIDIKKKQILTILKIYYPNLDIGLFQLCSSINN